MEAERQKRLSSSSIVLLILILSTSITLYFSVTWLLGIQNESDQIQGTILIITLLGLVSATGFSLYNSKLETVKSKKDLEIQTIKSSSQSEIQGLDIRVQQLGEELFHKHIQLAREVLSHLSDDQLLELLPPELKDRTDFFILRAREYEEYFDACQLIAKHLATEQKQLKALAKEACNIVLKDLEPGHLERLRLLTSEGKASFYGDIYAYLSVWLKFSIEYDFPMPDIGRSILDRKLYIDTIKFLRDQRLDWFFLPEEKHQKLLRKYLNILVSLLEEYR